MVIFFSIYPSLVYITAYKNRTKGLRQRSRRIWKTLFQTGKPEHELRFCSPTASDAVHLPFTLNFNSNFTSAKNRKDIQIIQKLHKGFKAHFYKNKAESPHIVTQNLYNPSPIIYINKIDLNQFNFTQIDSNRVKSISLLNLPG